MSPPEQEERAELNIAQWLEGRRGLVIAALVAVALVAIARFAPFQPVQQGFHVFEWVTEKGLDIAKNLFEDYGYLTTFLAPMLENTLFIGALIPGTLVMLLAGLSAHDGLISFWLAVPLAIAGAIVGDTISYAIGRFGWSRLGPETRLAKWSEEMRDPLMNHSVWLILSYHFAGYSRLIGPAAAGFLRAPLLRWMLLDYVGVVFWVIAFMTAGYLLGVVGLSLDDSDRNVQIFELILFGMFVIAVLTVLRAASRRRRRTRTPSAVETDGYHAGEEVPAPSDEATERAL